jgi:hypothetical protein
MVIFLPCPYTGCRVRAQVAYSNDIDKELQTTKEKATAELRHRVNNLLKFWHRKGEHKNGGNR